MNLVEAIFQNDVIHLMKFLEKGSNPNVFHAKIDLTPLHFAVQAGAIDVVALLLTAGADPNLQNKHGISAFDLARDSENSEIFTLLTKITHLKPTTPC